jgi:hypothetical protein
VRIRDSASGTGRYHFRLSWNIAGYDPERDRQPDKRVAMQQGVEVCQEAVVSRIADQYHYGDVSVQNIRADDKGRVRSIDVRKRSPGQKPGLESSRRAR